MTATERSVEPLPAYLNDCSCQWKPRQHRIDCRMFRRFEDERRDPDRERITGQRYEVPLGLWPVEIDVQITGTFHFDPVAFFQRNPRELDFYIDYVPDTAFEWWEKPLFYWRRDMDQCAELGFQIPWDVGHDDIHFIDAEVKVGRGYGGGDWGEQQTAELHAALGLNREGTERVRPADGTEPTLPLG